jgi:hypothetical protein
LYDHSVTRPRWLRRVSIGSLLIAAGILIGGAGPLVSFWPPLAAILWRRDIDQRAALWLLPVGALMSSAGTWWFATPTPRAAGWRTSSLATMLRVLAVVTCTVQLQLFLLTAAAFGYAVGLSPSVAVGLSPAILVLGARALLVAWSAVALMTCVRAARVAGEVGDPSGVWQASSLALLAPLMMLYFASTANLVAAGQWSRAMFIGWAIGAASIAGWSAVFFAGFAVVLHRRGRGSAGVAAAALPPPPAVAV